MKIVSSGMVRPLSARIARTSGRFAIVAKARAFGLLGFPPQAPQSSADSYGLLSDLLPCPQIRIRRANPSVSPMAPRTFFSILACSSRVIPKSMSWSWSWSLSFLSRVKEVSIGGDTERENRSLNLRKERGNIVRPIKGQPNIQPMDSTVI